MPSSSSSSVRNATASAPLLRRLRAWLLWWEPLPTRPYWLWVFALGALLFHVACFYWMTPFALRLPPQTAGGAQVVFVDPQSVQSATLAEQSSLMDFEPLFLPTRWNAEPLRTSVFDRSRRADPYAPYGAEVSPQMAALPQPQGPHLPQTASEALELDNGAIFATFGRSLTQAEPLSARGGSVVVEPLGKGAEPVLRLDLPVGEVAGLDEAGLGTGSFLVEVDATGAVAQPLLRWGTGLEARDRIWANWLHRTAAGWGLAPGTYQVTVGP